jgi:hypothetical protein
VSVKKAKVSENLMGSDRGVSMAKTTFYAKSSSSVFAWIEIAGGEAFGEPGVERGEEGAGGYNRDRSPLARATPGEQSKVPGSTTFTVQ